MLISEVKADNDILFYVAQNMREMDKREVELTSGRSPFEALKMGRRVSNLCSVILVNTVPVAVYGLSIPSLLGSYGVPWMLGTDEVYRHPKQTLLYGRAIVQNMRDYSPMLQNYVYTENKISIRWLAKIGFEIHEAKPYGVEGALFHRFSIGD